MLLDSTPECITAALAAFRAGLTLVSLPLPARGSAIEDYFGLVTEICRTAGVQSLVTDAKYVYALSELPSVAVYPFEFELPNVRRSPLESSSASFVQFTSGSTSHPKGVPLTLDELASNVLAIIDRLLPRPADVSCSWLPLSHDMGFVGMLLTSLCAAGQRWVGGGSLVLIQPEEFLRRPETWIDSCAQYHATMTAAPNFGLDLAVRRAAHHKEADLSNLRVCITGAERVRPETLTRFSDTFGRQGLSERSICPAYGLAEAALAVTLCAPDAEWRSINVDYSADELLLQSDALDGSTLQLVSSGAPLRGYGTTIEGNQALGPIRVSGPSVVSRYFGEIQSGEEPRTLLTNDLGIIREEELYVAGRLDDVLKIGGRKIFAADLENQLHNVGALRKGTAVVFLRHDGQLVVVGEPSTEASLLPSMAVRIKATVARVGGVSPAEVVFLSHGTLPKTSSGKVQRWRVAQQMAEGDLSVDYRMVFR